MIINSPLPIQATVLKVIPIARLLIVYGRGASRVIGMFPILSPVPHDFRSETANASMSRHAFSHFRHSSAQRVMTTSSVPWRAQKLAHRLQASAHARQTRSAAIPERATICAAVAHKSAQS
jgi:hypothetical protein